MNRMIFLLIFLFASHLYAGRPFIGFEGGVLSVNEDAYYGKYTRDTIANLKGSISSEKSGVAPVGLYEGYEINEYVSVIAKQRYFSTKLSAEFFSQPSMNFEIAKDVVPLNLGLRINLKVSELFGFYLEALPGVYIVDAYESGFFKNYHRRDEYFGVNFSGGARFVINNLFELSVGAVVDVFEIDQNNMVLKDGGDAGGVGMAVKFGVVF